MFGIHDQMLDDDTILFISDENGYENIYAMHLPTNQIRPITDWTKPVGSYCVINTDGKPLILASQTDPVHDTFYVLDPSTREILWNETINGKFIPFSRHYKRFFAYQTSHEIPNMIWELNINRNGSDVTVKKDIILAYPEEVLKQIVHGKAEAIEYETFDIDDKTGLPRRIHGFVLIPENLPDNPADRKAVITAFYGGENLFNKEYQIFLQAGFIVFSPAVRGSWGFGADYYHLNDRDLGGNEIIDLIYAGRYLKNRFGLSEQQIGLEGGSHGGYCAMRGLTFPDKVNGQREFFNWGFAIASYGISNIIEYYKTCNIPDWVIQKAGDPATEAEMLIDRSPISHAHRATGPILLVHGENDNRVPVEQSRQMAEALKSAGKPYTYLEIPGQGHGWRGMNENLRYFNAVFSFLGEL